MIYVFIIILYKSYFVAYFHFIFIHLIIIEWKFGRWYRNNLNISQIQPNYVCPNAPFSSIYDENKFIYGYLNKNEFSPQKWN